MKVATINPDYVSALWFDRRDDVDRSKMLKAHDITRAVRLIIDQDVTSDIDSVNIMPVLT